MNLRLTLAVALSASAAWSQGIPQTKVTASDASASDQLGRAVCAVGNTVVVGADQAMSGGTGAAYVFERGPGFAYLQVARLVGADSLNGDRLGFSVSCAVDGTVVVGAPQHDLGPGKANAGAVYVFEQQGGTLVELQKLTASDGAAGDRFGHSVSISDNVIAVGATVPNSGAGKLYVFERAGGVFAQVGVLNPSDGNQDDRFGAAVFVDGDTIVVGAPQHDAAGSDAGAVYTFVRTGRGLPFVALPGSKLVASDAAAEDQLGASLSLAGDLLVAGARLADDACPGDPQCQSGAAYVFERTPQTAPLFAQSQKLTALAAAAGDQFGASVSAGEGRVVVGAARVDGAVPDAGAAYVFERTTSGFVEADVLSAADAAANDRLGGAIAVTGGVVVVGATLHDAAATDAGAAYLFRVGAGVCELDRVTGFGAARADRVGSAVALSGARALVAAPGDDDLGSESGAVVVLERESIVWVQSDLLTAPGGLGGDAFGTAVALDGTTAVVGAPGTAGNPFEPGEAYAFELPAAAAQSLASGFVEDGDAFGAHVALAGDEAFVGSPGDDGAANQTPDSGAVYAYQRDAAGSAFGLPRVVRADAEVAGSRLGASVAASETLVVAGAPEDDGAGFRAGAVYELERVPSGDTVGMAQFVGLEPLDSFGTPASLGDLDGDGIGEVVVGAPDDDEGGDMFDDGAVWILSVRPDGSVISPPGKLFAGQPGIPSTGDQFGIDVAPLGDFDGNGVADLLVGDGDRVHVLTLAVAMPSGDVSAIGQVSIGENMGGFGNDGQLANDVFGNAVDALGDLDGDGVTDIVVGAPRDSEIGSQMGSVWIVRLNGDGTVKAKQKISPAQGNLTGPLSAFDRFGASVARLGDLDGDGREELAVSAQNDADAGDSRGAVYVLFLDAGGSVTKETKISATAGGLGFLLDPGDAFGLGLELLGDLDGDGTPELAVGAIGDDDGGPDRGALYVLSLNPDGTVKRDFKLSSTTGGLGVALDDGAFFGHRISLLDDAFGDGRIALAVAGASALTFPVDQLFYRVALVPGFRAGPRMTASDAAPADLFGTSLAVSGDTALVGAIGVDDVGSNAGAVYVLERSGPGLVETQKLVASDGQPGDLFGASVALEGDVALVGAPGGPTGAASVGATYVFERAGAGTDFFEIDKLQGALASAAGDRFGASVDLSGDVALIGAPDSDVAGPDAGAAHAFSLSGVDCPSLFAEPDSISAASGGTRVFDLATSELDAGQLYFLFSSGSGTQPGIPLDGIVIPLNFDGILSASLELANSAIFTSTLGVLSPSGQAQASLNLPPGLAAGLVGAQISSAYALFDLALGSAFFASNPVVLTLVP